MPIATGARLANTELNIVVTGGDGDGYGIGLGHFIHAVRRNLNITYIVMDNQIYGLTTGQASPTSAKNFPTKSTPTGTIEEPINPIRSGSHCWSDIRCTRIFRRSKAPDRTYRERE